MNIYLFYVWIGKTPYESDNQVNFGNLNRKKMNSQNLVCM